jgi:fructokinase
MFTVIGEALIDMVQPEPGLTFLAQPGGGPLNIAIGLQRLGHPTQMMARFSTGSLGALVRHHAESNELGLSSSAWTDDSTTLAFATLDSEGRASYDFYTAGTADWGWTATELAQLPSGTQALHTGSVAAFIAPGGGALLDVWERERAAGSVLLSFDPNVRPALVGSHDDAVRRVEAFVAASHVVKASDADIGWLYPDSDPVGALERWSTLGPALVVMTQGPDGCLGIKAGGPSYDLPGFAVDVVDTIGAGDSFESGLLSGIADAGALDPARIDGLGSEQVESILERSVLVSSMTCQRSGADPPTRLEYDVRRDSHPRRKN